MSTPPYRRDTLELTLEHVQGAESWAHQRAGAERLVMATLVWPRPLIAERVAARAYPFEKSKLDLAGRDWSERIFFKENVEGPFGLVIQVTEPLTAQELRRVTASLGDVLLKTTGTELARLAAGPWTATLARFPFTHLAGALSDAGKNPTIVAAGQTTILPGTPGPLEIPLSLPRDVTRVRRQRVGGRTRTRRETLHRKGDPAGTVRFDAVYYRT